MSCVNFYEERIRCDVAKCCGTCVEFDIEDNGYMHCTHFGVPVGLFDLCNEYDCCSYRDSKDLVEEIIKKGMF